MTSSNQIISINNDKYLIRKTATKLVLHHLPSLDIVHKHYSEVSYFCVNRLEIMLIYKNTLTFLKPKCPPLRLIEYQQEYLDWEPVGGLAMTNMVILYDKATIAFYYRSPKLEKSWSIDVIQEIEQVKHSPDEKFIALKVKQPKNTIFVWDLNNLSKKPNQQIVLKQTILKWKFHGDNLLQIMTETQFKIYFANEKTNQHFIQYYISLPQRYSSFLTLNQFSRTEMHSGRKSVNHVAFMTDDKGGFDVVELYDVEKRQARFKHSEFRQLSFKEEKVEFSQPIAGYEYEGKIHILGQVDTGLLSFEPKCLVLNGNFELEKVTQYKQHQGTGLQNIQYQNGYVFYFDTKHRNYKLGKFISDDGDKTAKETAQHVKILKEYSSEGIESVYLTKECVLFVNGEKKMAIDFLKEVQQFNQEKKPHKLLDFSVYFAKFNPKLSYYIYEHSFSIFFVCGIRYFKYDLKKKQFINVGFVLKNQRAKLYEVRTSTSSLVYKINEQYILIEYTNPLSEDQKMVFRTIKSSDNDKIISLRKDRWARVNLKEIVMGEGENELATFDLQRMYKSLLQQNSYFEYDLHWTTHGGMILAVKNYLFFLQVTQSQNGPQIHLIKKGHSYLHRRFSSSITPHQHITIISARHLVIYTGNRILKLGNQVQSYITENPYTIPDTLLNRQLQMREYFSPHHPSVVNAMLENGWFGEIVRFMEKVYEWVKEDGHSIKTLYQRIRIEDYFERKDEVSGVEERDEYGQVIVKKLQVRNQTKDIELLNKLCQLILSQPHQFHLHQSNPLILQNLLRSLTFQLENTRSFDFFSQTVITKYRLTHNKNKPFTTMDVAFLIHSINKDQALEFLKGPDEKMEWDWVKKYSVVLWYDSNVEKWRKWVEEIAMTQFRVNKDPFDCLFWYVLAGKKNLLVTLFKAQKFNSKQHDAMHTFLLRDFEDPKHRTAAVKNAYALIDKKRYIHAMAFLLLAQKKQECVRFAIDRLNDLNLGYLIHLLSYTSTQSSAINQVSKTLVEKGDVWAQHIGWVIEKRHVASYNVLLKQRNGVEWEYVPQVKGFHPSVVQFSNKIKESIPYKRELELKNNPVIETSPSLNFDHLNFDMDSFDMQPPSQTLSSSQTPTTTTNHPKQPQFYTNFSDILQQLSEEQQNGFKRLLNQKSIRHYMRHHFPCLALTLITKEGNSKLYAEVKRAYELEKYQLTGELSESVVEIAEELDDVMGLLGNFCQNGDYNSFLKHLVAFRQRFESALRRIKINQLNPPQKHQIGEILHYSYFSQQIFIQLEPNIQTNPQIQAELSKLRKTNSLGKVISGICLKVYSEMGKSLEAFKENIFIQANQDFWRVCKEKYDKLVLKKKEKHQKLMDAFEFSLNKHIKKEKDDEHVDFSVRMPKSSTMSLLLWKKIFEFLTKCDPYMQEKIYELKLRLDKIVKYWVQKEYIDEIETEINILISEGVEYRLKLNVLSEEFKEKELDTIEELLKLVYSMRELKEIEDKKNSQEINIKFEIDKRDKESTISKQQSHSYNEEKEKSAIQIFKNKSDGIKGFALNVNQGKGLEILVLFKKTMRKFEVADNLANRDRSKQGYNLIHQDSTFITDPIELPQEQLILSKSHLPIIQESLKTLFCSRKLFDGEELIKRSQRYTHHLNDYLKQAELMSQIDFNEIHSIEAHSALPIYFLGGKGLIEVCRFDTAKGYNRILCPGVVEIVKIQSVGQRLYLLDKEGSFSCFIFDWTFTYKPMFELKKMGIIDFTCPTPSQFGCITSNSFQYYDTLLHPKRQCVFKVQMSTPPVSILCLSPTQFVILRKQQVQVYDISKGQLQESYNIQGRGRSLYVDRARGQNYGGKIVVGRGDCKVKIIDLDKKIQSTIKVGNIQEQKEKVFIEVIKKFGHLYLCFRNDGSIYCFSD